jgi:hypothetical protein
LLPFLSLVFFLAARSLGTTNVVGGDAAHTVDSILEYFTFSTVDFPVARVKPVSQLVDDTFSTSPSLSLAGSVYEDQGAKGAASLVASSGGRCETETAVREGQSRGRWPLT